MKFSGDACTGSFTTKARLIFTKNPHCLKVRLHKQQHAAFIENSALPSELSAVLAF